MVTINAYAAEAPKGKLEQFSYELPEVTGDEVDIKVDYCGICHSDLSMLNNDWGFTAYPFVPGHEIVGTVAAVGPQVKNLTVGDTVGLGWFTGSCGNCAQCLSGDHNLCAKNEQTIVHRHGGFADTVRCKELWATPLPQGIDAASAGPLFCGGITVFNPIVQCEVKPTDKVGVIGIGGLGHLAIQFLNKWGCEVTAFTSSPDKAKQAQELGAHHTLDSTDAKALAAHQGSFDFILNTTNANLDWATYISLLAPKGRLHTVGAVPEPFSLAAFPMITGQKSLSGSPLGSPATTRLMLEFCARHGIHVMAEEFALENVNEAIEHLEAGKARYRVVLKV